MNERLGTAQEAAIGFARRMRREDVIEVIDFDSQARILQTFTNDVAALEKAIRATDVNGSTSLYNAIYVSLKELKRAKASSAEEIRRQAIVVLSDGDDTSSLVPYEEVLDLAKRSETAIYAIGLRPTRIVPLGIQGSRVRAQAAFAGNGRAGVLRAHGGGTPEDLRADFRRAGQSIQPGVFLEEPDAQRRLAPGRRAGEQAGADRPHTPGLLRTGPGPVGVMHLVPLVFYAAAAAAYLTHFAWRDPRVGRLATAILGGGILAHTFLIGMQTVHVGHAPLVGTTAALSAFVWLLGLSYLYVELTTDERAMGVFVAPLIVALYLIPALDPVASPRPPLLQSPLFTLHVVSMLFAYASFALACVLGVTYVLLFKEIKARHLGFFYTRLPSLQVLDAMNGRVISIGWLFLTLGIAIGGLWATQIQSSSDPRAQAMSIGDPKILVAIICWAVYSFALFARRAIGWSGRRAAWLSALAFVIVLLNFVPIGYFLTKSHNF